MSIFVPLKKGITLCAAFENLSSWTWNTIRDSARFGVSVGEETLTDLILLSLAKRFPHSVFVRKYSRVAEGTSGADWLWCFVGLKGCFLMQVQAKRIYGDDFPALPHKVGPASKWQVDILVKDAAKRGAFPAYVFYAYISAVLRRSTNLAPKMRPPNWGCSAGAATGIRPLIKAGKIGFADLYPNHIFPWRNIVCLKVDAAECAHDFAKGCMGGVPVDGWFADCDGLPPDVEHVAKKYVELRGTDKLPQVPTYAVDAKGIVEDPDLISDDLDGVAIIGDIENSCLLNGL